MSLPAPVPFHVPLVPLDFIPPSHTLASPHFQKPPFLYSHHQDPCHAVPLISTQEVRQPDESGSSLYDFVQVEDLPIALRKGTGQCTLRLISNTMYIDYVSGNILSLFRP